MKNLWQERKEGLISWLVLLGVLLVIFLFISILMTQAAE